MKAVVFTLGCKVNEVESASIMSALEAAGWEVGNSLGYADAYILNTCAVTREAEKKSRQLVARVRKFNPEAAVFVCGCASQKDDASFRKKGVTFVTGARKKEEVVSAFSRVFGCADCGLPYPKQVKTRAFVKIQDGCNNFCSYCIIPYLRGRETSRPQDDIVNEVLNTDSAEIVLTGINISSYNKGDLVPLVSALRGVDKRIRFGSLECNVITDGFLQALADLKDFAPQYHLSLQSGSDAVLKAINRRYTRAEYLEKCAKIYSRFPDAAITTDIISGFPTETEQDFNQSLSIIEEAGFARVHAFSFSPREGTAAFKMRGLEDGIKERRLKALLTASESCSQKYIERFCGSEQIIIAEDFNMGFTSGYTGNYIRVYVPEKLDSGIKYKVKLKQIFKDGVSGETDGKN